jgi:Winged helix-turn helix
MKPPLGVRSLTPTEHQQLTAGLCSSDAFTLRRCPILLASARREPPAQIARQLGCATRSVRHAIRAFRPQGLACVQSQSCRPKRTRLVLDPVKCEPWRALLHESPHTFGKPRSTWTLQLAAEVCWERGLPPSQVRIENIRQALQRLGVSGQRATHWITRPAPPPDAPGRRHPHRVLGFSDQRLRKGGEIAESAHPTAMQADALAPVAHGRVTRRLPGDWAGPTRRACAWRPLVVGERGYRLRDATAIPKPCAPGLERLAWGSARQEREPVYGRSRGLRIRTQGPSASRWASRVGAKGAPRSPPSR